MKLKYITRLFIILLLTASASIVHSQSAGTDYQKIIGRWVQSDGGYVLDLKKVRFDESIEAAYFNPDQIRTSVNTKYFIAVYFLSYLTLIFIVGGPFTGASAYLFQQQEKFNGSTQCKSSIGR